ncbi:MAG: hypothetical protein PHT30_01500 [Bacilli bacterium]|nr:hypothetical protein [Bacilli bacterium]
MNIETKTVRDDVSEYLKFGWKHTEDTSVRHGRGHHAEHVLARDKDMPNYNLIAALDAKYFSLKSQIKTYEPMDPLWGLIAFLCFVLPFIIYFAVKSKQKSDIEAHNANIHEQMLAVLKEAKPLI